MHGADPVVHVVEDTQIQTQDVCRLPGHPTDPQQSGHHQLSHNKGGDVDHRESCHVGPPKHDTRLCRGNRNVAGEKSHPPKYEFKLKETNQREKSPERRSKNSKKKERNTIQKFSELIPDGIDIFNKS